MGKENVKNKWFQFLTQEDKKTQQIKSREWRQGKCEHIRNRKMCMMTYNCNLSTEDVEVGGLP